MCVCVFTAAEWLKVGDVTCKETGVWGSGCSDYLRISCREALISLPRSHSTGLGLSHLQCKAERMGRGRGGESKEWGWGGGGRVGKHCINALSPSTSHMYSNTDRHKGRLALHAQIMTHGSTGEKMWSEMVSGVVLNLREKVAGRTHRPLF